MENVYNPRSNRRNERPKHRTTADGGRLSRESDGRDCSRSRSPDSDTGGGVDRNRQHHFFGTAPAGNETKSKDQVDEDALEATRRARMARLRAELEEEEAKLAQLAEASSRERQLGSAKDAIVQVDPAQLVGLDEDEQMKLLLGFSGEFGTTKHQKVEDNHKTLAKGAAAKHKERKYRQYMNRKNGFNRPLDKMD